MMTKEDSKKDVKEFFNQVGWKLIDQSLYQNAQFEDLRPVSKEYIHRCHMRVNKHLSPKGRFFLDAGSGPVQYPEYLTYSEDYDARVCMDISIVALQEARKRLGDHGRYVVGDIAHLPFKDYVFDGIVSLHTIHHVSMEDKLPAYEELYRTLTPGHSMVVVNGWTKAPLMTRLSPFMDFMKRFRGWWLRKVKKQPLKGAEAMDKAADLSEAAEAETTKPPEGTYVQKLTAAWLTQALEGRMDYEILVWRSVSVRFLRSVIYPDWGGRFWLQVLFLLEEIFPRFLGRIGQYPLVVVNKPAVENK
ncbi:MAG: class I SAM-dependent methyltransferase [Brevefilum sp.]|nr:class I SAM-dependent methyltransferase [Brevefilum sp.]